MVHTGEKIQWTPRVGLFRPFLDIVKDVIRGTCHLFGTHRRISCRVRFVATPKRGSTVFVARVTGTSRSRKGPIARFRDRRNCIFRDTISDITRVTPYWCRNGELKKIPQVLAWGDKKKRKRVSETGIYAYSLLRSFLSLKAKVGSSRFFHLLVHTFALCIYIHIYIFVLT